MQNFDQVPALRAVGTHMTLRSSDNEVIVGEVFAFDVQTGVITLRQPGSTPRRHHVRLVKEHSVTGLECREPEPGDGPEASVPMVDDQRSKDREERAVRAAQLEAAKIGVNVTREAQHIFDALAKTLPCRWEGQTIVVLEEIFIVEPYGPEECSSPLHDVAAMERVKKVLLAERNLMFGGD